MEQFNNKKDIKKISYSTIVLSIVGAIFYIVGIAFYIVKSLDYYSGDQREHVFNLISLYLALASVIVFTVYLIAFYGKSKAEVLVAVSACLFALSQLAVVVKHIVEAFHLSIWQGKTYGQIWHFLIPKIVTPLIIFILLIFFSVNFFKGKLSSMALTVASLFVLIPSIQRIFDDFAKIAQSSDVNYNLANLHFALSGIAQTIFFGGVLLFTINHYEDVKNENKEPIKKKLQTLVICCLLIVIFVAVVAPLTAPIAEVIKGIG